ncbi:hypothetical protein ACFTWD_35950 [Streptomyces sp. NPDC056943]|uniref:hypothetical protein n=1 Tax=Streptomyces sp. NPDC056943 TaxID=3345971 RepID=UPI00363516A3
MDPRQKPRLIEIIQNLRERIREARANGWLGEVEGLQVSFDAAMAKISSLKDGAADGRPQLGIVLAIFAVARPVAAADLVPTSLPGRPTSLWYGVRHGSGRRMSH